MIADITSRKAGYLYENPLICALKTCVAVGFAFWQPTRRPEGATKKREQ